MAVRNGAKLFRKTIIFHVARNSVAYVYLQDSIIKLYIEFFLLKLVHEFQFWSEYARITDIATRFFIVVVIIDGRVRGY